MAKTTIHGIHAVQTAIENDPSNIIQLWADTKSHHQRLMPVLELAQKKGMSVAYADGAQLEKLAKTRKHQNIVAEYTVPKNLTENDLWDLLANLQETPFLLILDEVTDPHNLGACLRTCEAAGVHAVVAPRDNAVGLTPTARKVASGAAELVPFIQVTNLARTLQTLKDHGVWILGTSDKARGDLFQQDLTMPVALVMGAEGKGMRRLTEKHCDILLSIPMAGQISSLNISVATGVCLYEAVRQRRLA
ncbi:MAG: 23S rRNA (guanosine-2'-O-) -methyltransferase rlmB (EC [uncultured Thiotrichaceae bacterium]|uniref:23S rRNA (guanosine-2'-O-)-methyltransferase RlmB n=1 Tax=uncultured Thiotrichaceae bacterium TaxID=298394 RepID=A0A6S6TQL5_9GAMM|nr:MAG: 23S rRNA (guanosine-2'-O-) -methyltransferase rlmB (EC [uncultured Thiotrichaceae bacterium]